jgi:nucleoid-associated protein YgaU
MATRRLTATIAAGLVILLAVIARLVVAGSGGAVAVALNPAVAPLATSSLTQAIPAAPPLLVLSPSSTRPGGSIGVWGRGFPRGATINIYLKQNAADVVNPVSVVDADQNGQFGGISVNVPESIPPGSVIIQAREYQGSLTASAAATIAAAQPVAEATATTEPAPTAAATAAPPSPTIPPTLAAQTQRKPTSEPTKQPQATPKSQRTPTSEPNKRAQPTPQPQPTPQSNPTEQPQAALKSQPTPQPRPTPQPQPTPQAKPAEQPQQKPAEEPQQKPSEEPQPKPDTSHDSPAPSSSYTVRAGDSLSAIAEHVYGDSNNWQALYEANRGAIGGDPNLIHPGAELVIPPAD